ncbi:testis-specific serine/threonine-protein kinase 1-like [Centruroides sculpturatus]|uniref:testis-specific serine/threonine-protein kinase 1-like n=1 Tax=Centruroides sculpturatus TaxID=218467 RepID=UPI000C6E61D7|nr:testis-specific serine/threonine-protein kinase 1-like [Centruroides sculpturatus]
MVLMPECKSPCIRICQFQFVIKRCFVYFVLINGLLFIIDCNCPKGSRFQFGYGTVQIYNTILFLTPDGSILDLLDPAIDGIVHRDIKCENLLLDKNDNLKITDFGFAKESIVNNETENISVTFCGSFAYACPEILQKIPYNAQLSDIWSMGIVLYVMLHGTFPFEFSNRKNFINMAKKGNVIFLESILISNTCKDLILKILKPEKERILMKGIKTHDWFCNFYDQHWEAHVRRSKTIMNHLQDKEASQISIDKPSNFWCCG